LIAGWGAEALGDYDGAVAAFARAVACADENAVMIAGHARALALAGDGAAARRLVAELERRGAPHDLYAYELGLVHLALGEPDAAVAFIDRAIAARSGWIVYAPIDPRLDPVRDRLRPEVYFRGPGGPLFK